MAIYGLETRLREYITNEFKAEMNEKIDELVAQFMLEFSANAESVLDVYSQEAKVIVTTFFNNKEQPKNEKDPK